MVARSSTKASEAGHTPPMAGAPEGCGCTGTSGDVLVALLCFLSGADKELLVVVGRPEALNQHRGGTLDVVHVGEHAAYAPYEGLDLGPDEQLLVSRTRRDRVDGREDAPVGKVAIELESPYCFWPEASRDCAPSKP